MKRPRPGDSKHQERSHSNNRSGSRPRASTNDSSDLTDNPAIQKYSHGPVQFKASRHGPRKLLASLQDTRKTILESAQAAGDAEVLLPAESGYIEMDNEVKTYKLTQKELRQNVDLNTARNIMNLSLTNFGPYNVSYNRNGRFVLIPPPVLIPLISDRHLLLCGAKGHVAAMDCQTMRMNTELQLREDVHHGTYLHNETFFALAQQRYT
jgi:U3 small nucleolar RNA-associated protein 7